MIFTEPRDTLEYLAQKIGGKLGAAAIVVIHGGIAREARRAAIAAFNSDPVMRVMVANDAAGEGVNLQRGAHLMVNYDLPWNPNRLEQRFGRIHRIGQTEVCHLWNLGGEWAKVEVGRGAAVRRTSVFGEQDELKALRDDPRLAGLNGAPVADRVFEVDEQAWRGSGVGVIDKHAALLLIRCSLPARSSSRSRAARPSQ